MVRGENGMDRNCKNLVHGNSDYCIRHGGRYSSEEEEKGSYNQEEEDWRRRNASPPRRYEEENYYQEDDWNRPIYVDKTDKVYVDVNLGRGTPSIHSVSAQGEPEFPVKNFKIVGSSPENQHPKL